MMPELIIFFCLIAIAIGVILWRRGLQILNSGKKSVATIIENIHSADADGGVYYPVISFLTDKNQTVTKELSIGFFPARRIGKKLQVIYDPDNPSDVVIYPGLRLVIIPRVLVVVGLTGVVIVILNYLKVISAIP
jgi:hypothetical protein